jgi:hypothetical protein
LFKLDVADVAYSKPKYHIINFYCDGIMIHRVFEPTLKRHIFIPQPSDWIEIADKRYEVLNREIKYLPDRIVVFVHLKELK